MTPPPDTTEQTLRIDRSERRSRFEVVARPEALFDIMLALWSVYGTHDRAQQQELGKKYFDNFRKAIPGELAEEMERAGMTEGTMWATLYTYVAANAPVGDDDTVLGWLADLDKDLAGEILCEMAWEAEPEAVERAIETRDPDDLAQVLPAVKEEARSCVSAVMRVPVAELGPTVARVLRTVRETAYAPHLQNFGSAIAASAGSTRHLSGALDPHALIERVTNGIEFEIPLGTRQLVLVPTVTLRPWTLITEFGDSLVIAYGVADEHLEHDPDAAPGWLVRFHKALGDDKRLRILREAANGGTSLGELADLLGVAKSTVFHHIGILRAAGLIRVVFGKNDDGINTYHLRHEAFGDAHNQLQKYLEVIITPEGNRS